MPLIDGELRRRLPPLGSQEEELDPIVCAKFILPGTATAWYVTEGEADGSECLFFGFVTQPENKLGEFWLLKLQELGAERDLTFQEGRLTEVVPAPEL